MSLGFCTRLLQRSRKMINYCGYSIAATDELSSYDAFQVELMKQECITVDFNDKVIGSKSKLNCHLHSEDLPLHRAFSLFLFNSVGELMMQQRASTKITFPDHFTNTCCSHPLFTKRELDENDHIGVKLAAQRRAFEELGIDKSQLPLDCLKYLTRVHYKASSNEKWGEHEIDYVLFAQRDVDININLNEVSQIRYVSLDKLDDFIGECKEKSIPLTPWFELIRKTRLIDWWKSLDNLSQYTNQVDIIRLNR